MEHNPRVVELSHLAYAVRMMGDFDDVQADAAVRLASRTRRALRLDAVNPEEAELLRQEAHSLGVVVFDGNLDAQGVAPRILVADDETLKRLGAVLESHGDRSLGSAIRAALAAYRREGFAIPFADGDRMDLDGTTRVMGILNVTPDSFSDGGTIADPSQAVEAAARLLEQGADVIDIGGESTRPGAAEVSAEEEIRRVVPVIEAVKRELRVRVSVDTSKAKVARRAVDAGADMVNDVSALSDPGMPRALRDTRVPVVVMHRRGTPATMQRDTDYVDLLSSVVGYLRKTLQKAEAAGIPDDKILVDPGLGFGKSVEGNLLLLRELPTLRSVGRAVVVGASRKSFIGAALDLPLHERLEGGLAVAAIAVWHGAHVIRTHDVGPTKRVTRMIDAVKKA